MTLQTPFSCSILQKAFGHQVPGYSEQIIGCLLPDGIIQVKMAGAAALTDLTGSSIQSYNKCCQSVIGVKKIKQLLWQPWHHFDTCQSRTIHWWARTYLEAEPSGHLWHRSCRSYAKGKPGPSGHIRFWTPGPSGHIRFWTPGPSGHVRFWMPGPSGHIRFWTPGSSGSPSGHKDLLDS